MSVLRSKFWCVEVVHRDIPHIRYCMPYSEREHAVIARRAARAEKPKLFYRIQMFAVTRKKQRYGGTDG